MDYDDATRRRSPQWIRDTDGRTLHGIALRLMHVDQDQGLTEGQEWLWAALISELEYRWRHPGRNEGRCVCMLCIAPFPESAS